MTIDPESIWESNPNHRAPRSEVEGILARWLIEDYRPLWDSLTKIETAWYLSREIGLNALARQMAKSRLKVHYRESYSLQDFRQFRLAESWQRDGSKIDDELAADLAAHLMEVDSAKFLRWAGNVQRLKSVALNPLQGFYCCLFDRAEIPLEFWTFPAATAYLQFRTRLAQGLTQECLRQWAKRLGLTTAKPQIVSRFTPDKGTNFLIDAARRHEFPLPSSPVTKAAQAL
jgi:hypothetical protein